MALVLPTSKRVALGLLVGAAIAFMAWLLWAGFAGSAVPAPRAAPATGPASDGAQAGQTENLGLVEVPVAVGSSRAAAKPLGRAEALPDEAVRQPSKEKVGSVRITIVGLTEAHRAAPVRVFAIQIPSPSGDISPGAVPVQASRIKGTDTYLAEGIALADGVAYVLFGDDEYPTIAQSARFVIRAEGEVHRTEIKVRDFSLGLLVADQGGVPLGPAQVQFETEPFSGLVKWICLTTSLDLKATDGPCLVSEQGFASTRLRCACRVTGTVVFPEDPSTEYPWIVPPFQVDVRDALPQQEITVSCVRGAFVEGRLQRPDGAAPGGIDVFFRDPVRRERVSVETQSDGTFRSPPLRPAGYLFYARVGGKSGQSYCLHEPIELRPETTHQIVDTLGLSSDVVGICVDGAGAPQENLRVVLTGAENLDLTRSGKTLKGGHFRIGGLYPGRYTVAVENRELTQSRTIAVGAGGSVADLGTVILSPVPDPAPESESIR